MKKIAITGITVGLLIFAGILFFWHRQNHPTDSMIRHRLLGAWVPNSPDGRSRTFALSLDGHCTATVTGKIGNGRMDGTWQIKDGFLTTTMTNNDLDMQVPRTDTDRIIRINSHEFVMQNSRGKQVVYKRTEP